LRLRANGKQEENNQPTPGRTATRSLPRPDPPLRSAPPHRHRHRHRKKKERRSDALDFLSKAAVAWCASSGGYTAEDSNLCFPAILQHSSARVLSVMLLTMHPRRIALTLGKYFFQTVTPLRW